MYDSLQFVLTKCFLEMKKYVVKCYRNIEKQTNYCVDTVGKTNKKHLRCSDV